MSWELISMGVRRYRARETYNELPNASNDAADVAACFRSSLPEGRRFNVTNLSDPTAKEASELIEAKLDRLDSNSILMIYFAGHAVETRGVQWLLFYDALPCFQQDIIGTGAISSDYFREIERRGRGRILIVVDACRTSPFIGRGGAVEHMRQDQFGEVCRSATHKRVELVEEDEEYQADVFKLLSCQSGRMASDNGAFAHALIDTVLDRVKKTDEVRIDDAFKTEMTRLLHEQNPWQSPYFKTNSLDPFILVPKGANSTKAHRTIVDQPQKPNDAQKPEPPKPSAPQKTPEQLTSQANAALDAGRYDEAERLADAALELNPSFSWAIWVRNQARRKREELKAKENEKERRNRELDQILNEGWLFLDRGEAATALHNAEIVLKERPKDEATQSLKRAAEAALIKSGGVWSESSTRQAGFRQELEIKGAKYGFCWIPAGEFDMGSPSSDEDRCDDETLHHVKLTKGYWLLETPVTQRMYEAVMGANPSDFKGADLPVKTVSWDESVAFCDELTKLLPKGVKAKLPTEAQWEYACRAGTKTAYWYGNTADSNKMNYDGNIKKATPVKSYAPNAWGLYDMPGNVYEWCADWYDKEYPSGTVTDPVGPDSGSYRVCRGGSWLSHARGCRSAFRLRREPGDRSDYLGFRALLVCD